MIPLRQSTASQIIQLGGVFVDSSDGDTEETGLTIANTDIKLHKNGATSLASKNSGGGTHMANGRYYATLDATDTNTVGPLTITIHVSGALVETIHCFVFEEAIYDAFYASGATGLLPANVTQISGDSTAADNAESFFDGTGYAGTNNVIPSVTTVTGNVNGSVASVSGAVGSVTGNVGGNVAGSVASVTGGINTSGGTITTLDALDTAQDTQHGTTQTYLSSNLGANGANATEAGGTGDHLTALALSAAGVSAVQSGLATPTNITAGTITTVTNLTNAPTNGDLTATMKASVTAAVPTASAIGTQVWSTSDRALSDPAGFKKNTAVANFMFLMVDATEHITPLTGATVTAERSIDGGAFASCSNSVTEVASGMYKISFSAADMNGDIISFKFEATGADPRYITISTET